MTCALRVRCSGQLSYSGGPLTVATRPTRSGRSGRGQAEQQRLQHERLVGVAGELARGGVDGGDGFHTARRRGTGGDLVAVGGLERGQAEAELVDAQPSQLSLVPFLQLLATRPP